LDCGRGGRRDLGGRRGGGGPLRLGYARRQNRAPKSVDAYTSVLSSSRDFINVS
jgi:hypothetical protein